MASDPENKPKKTSNKKSNKNSKKSKIRCKICKKKINMTYIECRCGGKFCGSHIMANLHECSFDYKKLEQEKIRKHNPVLIKEKVEKI